MANADTRNIEQEMLEIERKRLKIETDRLALDRKMKTLTFYSIVIPAILALSTLVYSTFSQNRQAEKEFMLRSAEMILTAKTTKVFLNLP